MSYKVVERREDMSAKGHLSLLWQDDGDIIVAAYAQNQSTGLIEHNAGVEFCTSGGKSPRTLRALAALFRAMEEDNADPNCSRGRMPE